MKEQTTWRICETFCLSIGESFAKFPHGYATGPRGERRAVDGHFHDAQHMAMRQAARA